MHLSPFPLPLSIYLEIAKGEMSIHCPKKKKGGNYFNAMFPDVIGVFLSIFPFEGSSH